MVCCGADKYVDPTIFFLKWVMWHRQDKDDKNRDDEFKCQLLLVNNTKRL